MLGLEANEETLRESRTNCLGTNRRPVNILVGPSWLIGNAGRCCGRGQCRHCQALEAPIELQLPPAKVRPKPPSPHPCSQPLLCPSKRAKTRDFELINALSRTA